MLCSPIIKLVRIGREYCIDQYWVPLVGFSLIFQIAYRKNNRQKLSNPSPSLPVWAAKSCCTFTCFLPCYVVFTFLAHCLSRTESGEKTWLREPWPRLHISRNVWDTRGQSTTGPRTVGNVKHFAPFSAAVAARTFSSCTERFAHLKAVYPGSKEWVDFRVMGHWNCNSIEEQLMLRIRTDRRIGAT